MSPSRANRSALRLGGIIVAAAIAGAVLSAEHPASARRGETVAMSPDAAGRAYAELTRRNPAFDSSAQILVPSFAEAATLQARLASLPRGRDPCAGLARFLPPDEEAKRQSLARWRGRLPDPPGLRPISQQ